jgi:hypothetical protein
MDPADSNLSFPFGEFPGELLLVIIPDFEITRGFLQDAAGQQTHRPNSAQLDFDMSKICCHRDFTPL